MPSTLTSPTQTSFTPCGQPTCFSCPWRPCISSLPFEIWLIILDLLLPPQRRPLLSVSRIVRSITRKSVFKSVDLLFGAWESIHPALNDGGGLDDIQVGAFARSLAILECIQRDPDFASSIQSLSVYAHVKDVESADPTWQTALASGVRAIPSLRHFHWFGVWPGIPASVVDALATSSTLQGLRLPAQKPSAFGADHLIQLSRLKWIRFGILRQIDALNGYWLKDLHAASEYLAPWIAANADGGHLRELSIYSELFPAISVSALGSLTTLSIWSPSDVGDIARTIFKHCPRLESLMMGCMIFDDIVPALAEAPDALPRLRELKIMSLDPLRSDDGVYALINFLRGKRHMRCLDTNLPGPGRDAFGAFIECIAQLGRIEMFGIDARSITDPDEMEWLARHLPSTVTALHLQMCWENLPVDAAEFLPLIDRLADANELRFLHFQSPFENVVAAAEALADALPTLEIVGFGNEFCVVERAADGGREAAPTIQFLRNRQIVRQILVDLTGGQNEWWWLMRFHDLWDDVVSNESGQV